MEVAQQSLHCVQLGLICLLQHLVQFVKTVAASFGQLQFEKVETQVAFFYLHVENHCCLSVELMDWLSLRLLVADTAALFEKSGHQDGGFLGRLELLMADQDGYCGNLIPLVCVFEVYASLRMCGATNVVGLLHYSTCPLRVFSYCHLPMLRYSRLLAFYIISSLTTRYAIYNYNIYIPAPASSRAFMFPSVTRMYGGRCTASGMNRLLHELPKKREGRVLLLHGPAAGFTGSSIANGEERSNLPMPSLSTTHTFQYPSETCAKDTRTLRRIRSVLAGVRGCEFSSSSFH